MSGRVANVFLRELFVGTLVEDESDWIEFRLADSYRTMTSRPVLGQWFEDHRSVHPRGDRPGELPAFFENYIPEGDLKLILHERLEVPLDDDFGLLCAVGGDLPGAVVVQLHQDGAPTRVPRRAPADESEPGLRFSLAGVQLKFSMIRQGERFFLPGRDARGEWIAKIAYETYQGVCANEWVIMEWARAAGFEVPKTELRTLADLVDVPATGAPETPVYLVKRYDRTERAPHRIHQEDFQQIVGRRSRGKYSGVTSEQLALLAMKVVGDDVFPEMMRRLTFVVASGNDDAHMKNWSVIYPDDDGRRAALSPLYDQVFTAQWPQFSKELALKLGGTKNFASVDRGRFREVARRIGKPEAEALELVDATLESLVDAWRETRDRPEVSGAYREALLAHWKKVPLLTPHAGRL